MLRLLRHNTGADIKTIIANNIRIDGYLGQPTPSEVGCFGTTFIRQDMSLHPDP